VRECNFDELPEKLQESITRINKQSAIKVLRCFYDDKNYAECTIKNGSLVGIFNHSFGEVDSVWLTSGDIEFLHNAIQSTRP